MLKIFCDFDGTICPQDVGYAFFSLFAGDRCGTYVQEWKDEKIDSRQMYLLAIEHLDVTPDAVKLFVENQRMDPHFREFVTLCESSGFPVYVVSDGMDIYIRPILERNELGHLNVYSNRLSWQHGHLDGAFPFYEHSCGRCANCKGHHLRRFRNGKDKMVLVGDGLSDICAAKEADTIFAKDGLADYCDESGIAYLPFLDFSDVIHGFRNHLIR